MPQTYKKLHWTQHSKIKMKQYGLSKQKLLRILYRPERKEKGIVPRTSAVMQTNKVFSKTKSLFKDKRQNPPSSRFGGTMARQRKAPGEIWLMFRDTKDQRKIISAWRYPGISKPGEEIPIPEDIKNEILNLKELK